MRSLHCERKFVQILSVHVFVCLINQLIIPCSTFTLTEMAVICCNCDVVYGPTCTVLATSYRRYSTNRRSLRRSRSFKVNNFTISGMPVCDFLLVNLYIKIGRSVSLTGSVAEGRPTGVTIMLH